MCAFEFSDWHINLDVLLVSGFSSVLPLGLSLGLFHIDIHLPDHEQSFEK